MASRLKKVTAAGQVHTGAAYLHSVVLTHTAAAGLLDVTDATAASGTVILTLRTVADGTASWAANDDEGVYFADGIRAEAITGAASFCYSVLD